MAYQPDPSPTQALFLVAVGTAQHGRVRAVIEYLSRGLRVEIEGWDNLVATMQRLAASPVPAHPSGISQAHTEAFLDRLGGWYAAQTAIDQALFSHLLVVGVADDVRGFGVSGGGRRLPPAAIRALATFFSDAVRRHIAAGLVDEHTTDR